MAKTWFSKQEQKWVSELPKVFWTGEVDYITHEKIYSDNYVQINKMQHGEFKGWESRQGTEKLLNAVSYYEKYGLLPFFHVYGRGRYEKCIFRIVKK